MNNQIAVGLLGLGVVGSGVIRIIEDHQKKLAHQLGCEVQIKRVLIRDPNKDRNVSLQDGVLTTNPKDVLEDPDIDIIVEVMGGVDEAYEHISQAFQAKKHVITANKDLIALHGPALEKLAGQHECDLFYEASVAGGIPILRGLTDGLVSDQIHQIMGIVNGTTNYILTKMDADGATFHDALTEAQKLGFAEADPTADVEGLDAARKMAILARLAFSSNVNLQQVDTEGIANIALADLEYGKQLGYTMKLIGYAKDHDQSVEVSVQPTLLSKTHPLAEVKNEYNAVYVNGAAIGETMFYGPGAGSLPTATAVVSDIVEVIKNIQLGATGRRVTVPQFNKGAAEPNQCFSQYYLRLQVGENEEVFAAVSKLFLDIGIRLEKTVQKPGELILVTESTSLENLEQIKQQLVQLEHVNGIAGCYRVEGEEGQ